MIHSTKDFIYDLWCDIANKPEKSPLNKPLKKIPSLEELKISQWCPELEKLQRNRLIMGAFRYGLLEDQDFNKYDLVLEIKKRLERYIKTKNLEYLVDTNNMCLLQFIKGKRLGQKLKSIDDGEHTPEIS